MEISNSKTKIYTIIMLTPKPSAFTTLCCGTEYYNYSAALAHSTIRIPYIASILLTAKCTVQKSGSTSVQLECDATTTVATITTTNLIRTIAQALLGTA